MRTRPKKCSYIEVCMYFYDVLLYFEELLFQEGGPRRSCARAAEQSQPVVKEVHM